MQQGRPRVLNDVARNLNCDILVQVQARPTHETDAGLEIRLIAEAIDIPHGEAIGHAVIPVRPPLITENINASTRFVARKLMTDMMGAWSTPATGPGTAPGQPAPGQPAPGDTPRWRRHRRRRPARAPRRLRRPRPRRRPDGCRRRHRPGGPPGPAPAGNPRPRPRTAAGRCGHRARAGPGSDRCGPGPRAAAAAIATAALAVTSR